MNFIKGYIPWNKGKIGVKTNDKGHPAWNKGLTNLPKHSEETKLKMSLSHKGKIFSIEHRKNLSEAIKGEKNCKFGKKLSQEEKDRISRTAKKVDCGKWMIGRIPAFITQNKGYHPTGDKNPAWKGGVTKQNGYSKLLRKRRRALEKNGGDLSIKTIQIVYEDNIKRFGTLTCIYCLQSIPFGKDTLEHKQPLSRNGTNEYNNLAIACFSCNSKKNSRTEEEYMDIIGGGKK